MSRKFWRLSMFTKAMYDTGVQVAVFEVDAPQYIVLGKW